MQEDKHISWDEYFMGIALLSAMRSKDPSTKVGAAIVKDKRVLSLGYNGMPRGVKDEDMPWGKSSSNPLETKYPYVVHAELNAILNANKDLTGSTLYVTMYPCNECAKAVIQAGIVEIIYLENKHASEDSVLASKFMLEKAGIKIHEYKGRVPSIEFGE